MEKNEEKPESGLKGRERGNDGKRETHVNHKETEKKEDREEWKETEMKREIKEQHKKNLEDSDQGPRGGGEERKV